MHALSKDFRKYLVIRLRDDIFGFAKIYKKEFPEVTLESESTFYRNNDHSDTKLPKEPLVDVAPMLSKLSSVLGEYRMI